MTARDPDQDPDLSARPFEVRGRSFTLRPLGPADASRLQDFFYSHTIETIQLRYGHAVARMTSERAYDLVNVDQTRDLALAIIEQDGLREIIHGIGRYYVDPNGNSAEVAFVVRESCRQMGFGTRLMHGLVSAARRRGLGALWGRVRRDNLPMLALFRRFGGQPVARDEADPGHVEIRIALHEAGPLSPTDRAPLKPRSTRPKRSNLRKRKIC